MKWGLIALVVLIVIGALAGSGENSSTPSSNNNTESETTEQTTKETVEVVTSDFIAEFDKNQLAAEQKYEGKIVKLTAFVDNISEDILGSPFLSLNPVNDEYYFDTSIKCTFADSSALTSLENGQSVTVMGEFDSQDLGIIGLKNCQLQ